MNATVVKEKCIGCGACAAVADGVFTMNDEGIAEATGSITEENKEEAKNAAESCPTDAIEISE
jgi:ferredoxin